MSMCSSNTCSTLEWTSSLMCARKSLKTAFRLYAAYMQIPVGFQWNMHYKTINFAFCVSHFAKWNRITIFVKRLEQ